jgi:hypothetical protein
VGHEADIRQELSANSRGSSCLFYRTWTGTAIVGASLSGFPAARRLSLGWISFGLGEPAQRARRRLKDGEAGPGDGCGHGTGQDC